MLELGLPTIGLGQVLATVVLRAEWSDQRGPSRHGGCRVFVQGDRANRAWFGCARLGFGWLLVFLNCRQSRLGTLRACLLWTRIARTQVRRGGLRRRVDRGWLRQNVRGAGPCFCARAAVVAWSGLVGRAGVSHELAGRRLDLGGIGVLRDSRWPLGGGRLGTCWVRPLATCLPWRCGGKV